MAPPDSSDWSGFLQAAFLAVLESSDEGLIVFDDADECRMIGRRAGEMFGVEPAAHVGRSRDEVLLEFAKACEAPDAFIRAVAADASPPTARTIMDIDVRTPRRRTVSCRSAPIAADGTVGRVIFVRDVTRQRAAERMARQLHTRLLELTPYDPLTGLLNERRLREELEREHGRSARAWDGYAVLRLDVDGMAAVNDQWGVPVGDRALQRIATSLKACLREYDILARLDGDEFAVLLPSADGVAATAVAERMAGAVAGEQLAEALDGRVTVSVGIALWIPPSAEIGTDILTRAGDALRKAKEMGGGKIAGV